MGFSLRLRVSARVGFGLRPEFGGEQGQVLPLALPSGSHPPPEAGPTPVNIVEISLDQELVHLYDHRATE